MITIPNYQNTDFEIRCWSIRLVHADFPGLNTVSGVGGKSDTAPSVTVLYCENGSYGSGYGSAVVVFIHVSATVVFFLFDTRPPLNRAAPGVGCALGEYDYPLVLGGWGGAGAPYFGLWISKTLHRNSHRSLGIFLFYGRIN